MKIDLPMKGQAVDTGKDYAIAALGGAVTGFFDNQAKVNAEAKLQAENERLGKLLLMKEDRITARELLKQPDYLSSRRNVNITK